MNKFWSGSKAFGRGKCKSQYCQSKAFPGDMLSLWYTSFGRLSSVGDLWAEMNQEMIGPKLQKQDSTTVDTFHYVIQLTLVLSVYLPAINISSVVLMKIKLWAVQSSGKDQIRFILCGRATNTKEILFFLLYNLRTRLKIYISFRRMENYFCFCKSILIKIFRCLLIKFIKSINSL